MSEESNKKSKSIRNWIIACVGAILIIVGGVGIINNESVNLVLIEAGAAQTAASIVEEQPKSGPVMLQVADVIDSAVAARLTSPKELSLLINQVIDIQLLKFDPSFLVNAVVNQINQQYAVSKTEEEYIGRLKSLARGIRAGVAKAEESAADDKDMIPLEADVVTACGK